VTVNPAVTTGRACAGVEQAVLGAAKIAAFKALSLASTTVHVLAVALLVTVDLAITTGDLALAAASCIKLAGRSAAEVAAIKAQIRASMTIQICAVALLVTVDLAITALTCQRDTGARVDGTGASTSQFTATKPLGQACGRAQLCTITHFAGL
jgi:hypothetical protein